MPQAERRSPPEAGDLSPPDLSDYPVREYVASMAGELAGMARWDGDEALAAALEAAAEMARRAAPATG